MELSALKLSIDDLSKEVNSLVHLPVESLSKSSLAKVSLELKDIAKRITVESQKGDSAHLAELQAIQNSFRGLVETVPSLSYKCFLGHLFS